MSSQVNNHPAGMEGPLRSHHRSARMPLACRLQSSSRTCRWPSNVITTSIDNNGISMPASMSASMSAYELETPHPVLICWSVGLLVCSSARLLVCLIPPLHPHTRPLAHIHAVTGEVPTDPSCTTHTHTHTHTHDHTHTPYSNRPYSTYRYPWQIRYRRTRLRRGAPSRTGAQRGADLPGNAVGRDAPCIDAVWRTACNTAA